MPRIFIPPDDIIGDTATLPEAEAKRLTRVLRLTTGDRVGLFDGRREYTAEISFISSKSVKLKIIRAREISSEPRLRITLGQGLPKGEKLEWVVQKAVELGAAEVIPVLMERSVKRPGGGDELKNLARLRKIATEAAQQSGRAVVPEIPDVMALDGFLEHTKTAAIKLLLYEGEKAHGLREVLRGSGRVDSVAVIVGPEGGLTEEEVGLAESAGYQTVSIGPRILRTETAGIAAIAVVQYELGDLG